MNKSENVKLNMLGLPVIKDNVDLSKVIHISINTIYQLSIHSEKYYKIYYVQKKSGSQRKICQPSRKLKGLQSWILVSILNKLQVSSSCKGFRKGSSTLDNALPHIGANTILNIDLKDFFPTITSKQVFNIFKAIGYNDLISTIFTNICTFEGNLPQGSPCSPMLANLVTWNMDLRIQGFVGKRGISYTRYADDLTFSGLNPSKVCKIIPMIKKIIENEQFEINHNKTRVTSSARLKMVTGLVINEDRVGIGKQKYKILRAKIHHLTLPLNQNNIVDIHKVKGWLSYLKSVDNERFVKVKKYISNLAKKYPNTLITILDK